MRPRFPGGAPVDGRNAAELLGALGLRGPGEPRPDRTGDARRRARRASSTCSCRAGGNFLEVLPDPAVGRGGARADRRCACTWTSSSRRRCWSTRPRTVLLLPATTRYEIPGGVTETRPSGGSSSPRRSRARGSTRRARSGGSSASLAARARPELRGRRPLRRDRGYPRGDRAGRAHVRRDRSSSRAGRPVPVRRPAAVRGVRVPDRGRQGPLRGRPHRTVHARPAGMLQLSTRRGKQFNSMVHGQTRQAHRGGPEGGPDRRAGRRASSGSPTATTCSCGASTASCEAAPRWRPSQRGNVNRPLARGQRADRARLPLPESGIPDYTAWVEVLAPD